MKLAILLFTSAVAFAQLPWEKNHDRVGLALYRDNCAVCHDIDQPPKMSNESETKKLGPSLYQVSQRRKRDYIAVRIRFGGQLMPAFAKKMTAGEIETLLDWMEKRTTPATASGGSR